MIKAANFLNSYDGIIDTPTLIMHGGADKITNPRGSKAFAKRVKGKVTFKEWNGLYHEIHNESNRSEVLKYTLNWINQILKK
jgi:alpha-beta hydrolase superfamily lysophospholipase